MDCNRKCNDCGTDFREAVCVHTDKIYDSCRDKDCLENVRVYLTGCGQDVVDKAINVKCTKAEIIWVFTDMDRSKYKKIGTNRIGKPKKSCTGVSASTVQSTTLQRKIYEDWILYCIISKLKIVK